MKLVIAEKPSVALTIAKAICATDKKDGYYEGSGYIVSWCVGHLVSSAPPEAYNEKWKEWSLESLPLLPTPFQTAVISSTSKQFNKIEQLINRSDVESLVCATDCGREGELIFRLVYDMCDCKKPFERLWISSLETKAIVRGFNELQPSSNYDNLYKSAFARLKADWYVGINYSRLYSLLSNTKLTVGRVQSPVVNLIVERQREIDNFKPEPYYIVEADCGDFVATSERFTHRETAEEVVKLCNGQQGKITELKKEEKVNKPPTLFDLTTLQREANRIYGYTAQQVLDVAQELYESKLITYPRTDSKYITKDMINSTVKLMGELMNCRLIEKDVSEKVDCNIFNVNAIVNDSKVTDHHAIIPTSTVLKANLETLGTAQTNCLKLIIYRFFSAIYTPCVYDVTSLKLVILGKSFTTKEKILRLKGYKLFEITSEGDVQKATTVKDNCELKDGKIYWKVPVKIISKETSPPRPYDDSSLLSAMENAGRHTENQNYKDVLKECAGIGTPATRAGIIERVISVGYVERKKKQLYPTRKGYSLVDVLPDEIKSVETTAKWEEKLSQISSGTLEASSFLEDIFMDIRFTVAKDFQRELSKDAFIPEKTVIGKCPRCNKNVYETAKTFSCESGKDGCGFVIWKNNKFFTEKKKKLTASLVKKLLDNKEGVMIKGLYSTKKNKTYDCVVALEDTGKYINFKLKF